MILVVFHEAHTAAQAQEFAAELRALQAFKSVRVSGREVRAYV